MEPKQRVVERENNNAMGAFSTSAHVWIGQSVLVHMYGCPPVCMYVYTCEHSYSIGTVGYIHVCACMYVCM